MEDETASAQMGPDATSMVGMDGTGSMPVKSVDDAMNEPQKVMDEPYDDSVANGNGNSEHPMDTGMDTSQQVTEDSTPKDSYDQMVSEEKKEEPKPEEKKSSFGGSLFDSILNKAWTSKKEEPVVEEKKDESEEEDDNVETKSDDDDDIGNDESKDEPKDENDDSNDANESKDEPKDDADDDGEKDTFDKMLSDKETEPDPEPKESRTRNETLAKEKEVLVKNPKNCLEENISEAFKTLEVYQKSLEAERTRCIKAVKDGISVEVATSITRKLRKLYAVTQKNMDLLDRAIVESFVENYPTESTRIHMGRMAPTDPPSPPKRLASQKKKKKPAGKVKVKGKKKPGPKNKGKNVIKMNGSPVYTDYVTPSLSKKRKKYNESDVECIDVSDDEYYAPKKRSKPGPASKKSRPGPASKKK